MGHKRRHGSSDEDTEPQRRPSGVARLDKGSTEDLQRQYDAFEAWCWDRRQLDARQLDGDTERAYFAKFVRRWNDGRLSGRYYHFNEDRKRRKQRLGPDLPASSSAIERLHDRREYAETAKERERESRAYERKKERKEAKEDERDNRATGRERLLEKRAETAQSAREMARSRESGGMLDLDADALMGGDSFQAALAARERQYERGRGGGRRAMAREEKEAALQDRAHELRAKEDATVNMFKQLAAARFGASSASS